MNTLKIKDLILTALKNFHNGTMKDNAIAFFNALGYDSQKRIDFDTPDEFIAFLDGQKFHQTNALFNEWQSVSLLFQLTDEEMSASGDLFRVNQKIDHAIIESYLFFAITLQEKSYYRTALSKITREINKLFKKPVLVLFKHGDTLTLAIINRRLHKRDESKDVLEKVTLIKDINFNNPHRAHIEILHDFSLKVLRARLKIDSFVALHQAWEKVLDTSELNKRFFKEISDWYFWAVQEVSFPKNAGDNQINVIRLITRLIFVWFLKERGLIPATLFDKNLLEKILYYKDTKGSTYYKAILQNLFFATLNQEMNTLDKPNNRKFRGTDKNGQRDQHYLVHNVYRYEGYFRNAKDAFDVFFANIPFLNGGLFECLDKKIKVNGKETVLRIDGFSERTDNEICVPDILFFTETPQSVDLNVAYGTKNKKYPVQGIINIFNRYKFTIAENTPIEEEIALDPELLGKVFENLLAAYNPETGTTARKQTGSFYTPREIVNYMVDESLIAYLENQLGNGSKNKQLNTQLRTLVGYNEENHGFNEDKVQQLITAIDQIKMLDPACGSGAFPMGGLHKLVSILSKLDPNNARWKEQQIAKAKEIPDSTFRDKAIEDIEHAFTRNELDYGRKLYLIQNGIFGIDIQPIAVQIAKLRFFISLLVDQKINESRENRGVRPLPNLETKFVAANTLIGLEKPKQATLRNLKIDAKEKELAEVRASYFTARTPKTKNKYRERDQHIRAEISELLLKDGFPRDITERLAKWNPYDQNALADFFDASWMFGVSDGFDVVIGNPPYLSALDFSKIYGETIRKQLNANYISAKGAYDLFILFIEKGLNLSNQHGWLTYITPNKYLSAKYAVSIRDYILNTASLEHLVDVSSIRVFKEASVYPIISFFSKKRQIKKSIKVMLPQDKNVEKFELSDFYSTFVDSDMLKLLPENIWGFLLSNNVNLLSKIIIGTKPLEEFGNINATSTAGEAEQYGKNFVNEHLPNSFKVINTGTIDRYESLWGKREMTHARIQFLTPYLSLEKASVSTRRKYIFQSPKIIFAKMAKTCEAYLDLKGEYASVNTNCFYQPKYNISLQFICGFCNSRFFMFLYQQLFGALKMSGGYYQFQAPQLRTMPLKKATSIQQTTITNIVDQILTTKRTNPKADTSGLEAQIDQLVYQLYGLTDEEIKIVEEQ